MTAREIGFTVPRVFVEIRRRGLLLHEVTGAGCTPCFVPVYAAGVYGPAVRDVHEVSWCGNGCWKEHRRCVVCGAPAGDESECGPCTRAAIEADKRIERAAA